MSLTNYLLNLTRIFFPSLTTKCSHHKVSPNLEQAYCPDCGKLIKSEWYVARCSCCGVKIKAMVQNGEITSQNHYCSNCGSEEFVVEKIDKINFIDINFAALLRVEVENEVFSSTTKCWQEKINEQPKLLTQFQ